MRRIRKKSNRIVDELLALRSSRGSIDDFFFSHQKNFCENCRLMHSNINNDNETKALFPVAYRQYYVFLISCWETYFRDVFVYVHTKDEKMLELLFENMKPAIDTFEKNDITFPELLSKSFNFQNINDLEEAYDGMWGSSFLKHVCSTDIGPCGINGQIASRFVVKTLFDDWYDIIKKVFSIRHKVVHDANYRPDINVPFIQKAEALFLLIPQVATQLIADKFNLKRVAFTDGELSVPYLFTVSEILSNDWVLVE